MLWRAYDFYLHVTATCSIVFVCVFFFFLGTLNLNYEVSWRNLVESLFTASYFKMEVTEYKEHLINPGFQGISSMQ